MNIHYDPRQLGLSVSHYSGDEASVICPFHNDHKPSATFNIVTGLFYCFACGKSSNAAGVADHTGGHVARTFIPIVKRHSSASDMPWHSLLMGDYAYDHSYLRKRLVTNAQIKKFGIRKAKNALVFPMFGLDGTLCGVTLRRRPGLFPKYLVYGDKPPLWPLKASMVSERYAARTVFIVEGIFGVLRADLAGVMAFATTGAMVKHSASRILNNIERPLGFFDDDDAGLIAGIRLLQIAPLSRVILPGGEADELSIQEWRSLGKRRTVVSFGPLVKRAYDKPKVKSHIKRRRQ